MSKIVQVRASAQLAACASGLGRIPGAIAPSH